MGVDPLSRPLVQIKHWVVAAFFAVLLLLVGAPAYAHPGHHGDHAMHIGHHEPNASQPVDVKAVLQGEAPVALVQTEAASSAAPKIAAIVSVATSSLLGAQTLPRGNCHGTCCFGISCCSVCIVPQASSLIHQRVPSTHVAVVEQAVLGVEPSSLLEPPNTRI